MTEIPDDDRSVEERTEMMRRSLAHKADEALVERVIQALMSEMGTNAFIIVGRFEALARAAIAATGLTEVQAEIARKDATLRAIQARANNAQFLQGYKLDGELEWIDNTARAALNPGPTDEAL